LVGSSQRNYFENATACSKRTLKTTVATFTLYAPCQELKEHCNSSGSKAELKMMGKSTPMPASLNEAVKAN